MSDGFVLKAFLGPVDLGTAKVLESSREFKDGILTQVPALQVCSSPTVGRTLVSAKTGGFKSLSYDLLVA